MSSWDRWLGGGWGDGKWAGDWCEAAWCGDRRRESCYNWTCDRGSKAGKGGASNEAPSRKVFVGGLLNETEERSIAKYFSRFGEITDIKMCKEHGNSKGFCFVTFMSLATAMQVVLDKYHDNSIDGKWVDCKFAKSPRFEGQCGGACVSKNIAWSHSRAANNWLRDTNGAGHRVASSTEMEFGSWSSDWGSLKNRNQENEVDRSSAGWSPKCEWEATRETTPRTELFEYVDHTLDLQYEPLQSVSACERDEWCSKAVADVMIQDVPSHVAASSGDAAQCLVRSSPPPPPPPPLDRPSPPPPPLPPPLAALLPPRVMVGEQISDRVSGLLPRVLLLDPLPATIYSDSLLAVFVPDESQQVCREAANIAMAVLQCTPSQDVQEDYVLECVPWERQVEREVGAEFMTETTRFYVACMLVGPFAGTMAVGIGSNKYQIRRACHLSVAVAAVQRNNTLQDWRAFGNIFGAMCERAIALRAGLLALPPVPSAERTLVDVHIFVPIGEKSIAAAVACERGANDVRRVCLHMILKDLTGQDQSLSTTLEHWPLPRTTIRLLDGLYALSTDAEVVHLQVMPMGCWCTKSKVAVEKGVDTGVSQISQLETGHLCQQAGVAVLLQELGEHGPVTVLRTSLKPSGWVSLAEWCDRDDNGVRSEFMTAFHDPTGSSWEQAIAEAVPLDDLRDQAHMACAEFEEQQAALRDLVQKVLQEADNGEAALVRSADIALRDVTRGRALQQVREYVDAAGKSCILSAGWQNGCDREHQAAEACARRGVLEEGNTLDAERELMQLTELRDEARQARAAARIADAELVNAQELEKDNCEIAAKEKVARETRDVGRRMDRAFQKRIAQLSRLARDHAPEMLPGIVAKASAHVWKELMTLKSVDQARVLDVFAMEWRLAHYEQELDRMENLSKCGSRHQVFATKYDRTPCVLKIFDLSIQTSLAGFLREVVLHGKLQHPLVVPLRRAFLDSSNACSMRGVLHFDRYLCDLDEWGQTHAKQAPEPLAAVRRHAYAMTQSVAYIHLVGVVHGDLKPSNWLLDEGSGLPRLCDFETAKDRGPGGATTTHARTTAGFGLQTRGYAAPELVANPTLAKSRASDVFALGSSIEYLLNCVSSSANAEEQQHVRTLVNRMICESPSERISAQDAQLATALVELAPCSPKVSSEPPPYWARRGTYEWHRSPYMEREVVSLLRGTTCSSCLQYGLATDVRIVKVCRVENLIHWRSFSSRRTELAELAERSSRPVHVAQRNLLVGDLTLDNVTNEVFLWHGLPSENVPMVAHSGLDERIANCKGLYGAGIYLTDQWCKALQYARARNCSIRHKRCGQRYRCSCQGPKRVLLCRALLGEAYYVKPTDRLQGQRRPPERHTAGPGMVYDSIIAERGVGNGGWQNHSEFVLFDRKSVYPEWIIELNWD